MEQLRQEVEALRRALSLRAAAEPLPERFDALVCRAGEAWLAVPLAQVLEVVPRLPLSPLPEAPEDVAGYAAWRGGFVPVVDLGRRFGAGPLPFALEDRIVLVQRVPGEVRGLLLSAAEGVERVEKAALSQVAPETPGAAWALGYVTVAGQTALLVSLDELLRPLAALAVPADETEGR